MGDRHPPLSLYDTQQRLGDSRPVHTCPLPPMCMELLKPLLDDAKDAFQVMSSEGYLVYTNRMWRQVLGYTPDETPTCLFLDLVHVASRQYWLDVYQTILESQQEQSVQIILVARNGAFVPVYGDVYYRANADHSFSIWSRWQFQGQSDRPVPRPSIQTLFSNLTSEWSGVVELRQQNRYLETQVQELQYQLSQEKQRSHAMEESVMVWQQRYTQLAIAGKVSIWDWRLNQASVDVDAVLWTSLGYTPAEFPISYDRRLQLIDQRDRPRVHTMVQTYLKGQAADFRLEYRVLHKNGSVRWLLTRGRIIRDAAGVPYRVVGTDMDITDRKLTEQALERSITRYRNLAANIPGMIFQLVGQTGRPYRFLYVSPVCQAMFQLTPEEAIANPEAILAHCQPEGRVDLKQALASSAQTLCPLRWIGQFWLGDRVKWLQIDARPERQPDHSILWDGLVLDITSEKRIEKALRQSEERYRAIVDDQTELICRFLPDGVLTFVNDAFCRYFDQLPHQLIGQRFVTLLSAHDPAFPPSYLLTINSLTPIQPALVQEHQVLHPNQELTWLEWSNRAIFDEQGRIVEFQAVGRDTTARKRAEDEIYKAFEREKELGELRDRFVSTISHEFRTPLTAIQSSAELLNYYEWTAEERQERFQQIYEAIRHMTHMVDDVLLIGKIEAGKLQFNPEVFDLNQLCHTVIAEIQHSLTAQHTLSFQVQGQPQSVYLDHTMVRLILTNLLSNAVKYSPDGGEILLRLEYQTGAIAFQVSDEGIGILPKDQTRLFTAFHRGENVETIQGTGLGLSIVKRCVDLQGGSIEVDSTVGIGTTVSVTLPLKLLPDWLSD